MEPQEVQQVYDEIVDHIKQQGGAYSSWYAGITSDWENRLFNEHKVPREGDYWYRARQCYTNIAARKAGGALLRLGCDGEVGGGDHPAVYVYAYLKGTMTNP